MKYYAIPDIHGRHDLLEKAVDAILGDVDPLEDYKIITLGDYIDRGKQSCQVIDFLIDLNCVSLCGNHEDMMVQAVNQPTPRMLDWWVGNGGGATLQSYGWGGSPYGEHSVSVIKKDHIDWINSLPKYYETDKQVFVHAGIPSDDLALDKQNEEKMIWMLYNPTDMGGYRGKHVVHGHHQFADGPHQWIGSKRGGRTDLDCWAYYTGRLVIGVFDDTQGHALKFLEVTDD